MKIKKAFDICKKTKLIATFFINESQWLTDGIGAYLIDGAPVLSEEYICGLYDISDKQHEKIHFKINTELKDEWQMKIKSRSIDMPKKQQNEACEQIKLFRWADFMKNKYPGLSMLYHIPNGGSRNKAEAANLKRQGVRAGVPDICLPVPSREYHGLYIEMKYGRNKATQSQTEWLSKLSGHGYAVAVCYGWEQAAKLICKYLDIPYK